MNISDHDRLLELLGRSIKSMADQELEECFGLLVLRLRTESATAGSSDARIAQWSSLMEAYGFEIERRVSNKKFEGAEASAMRAQITANRAFYVTAIIGSIQCILLVIELLTKCPCN